MTAAAIGAALKERMAALTFNPAIPVAWPNRDFDPAGHKRFIEISLERAPNERLGIRAMHRQVGTLIAVLASQTNHGSGQGDGIADAIAAHFPADLRIALAGGGSLRVPAAPTVRAGYRDGAWWRTPVTIPFEVLST